MEEKTIEIVSTPSIDLGYYIHIISDFVVSNSPSAFSGGLYVVKVILGYLVGMSIVLSVLLLIGIVLSVERLKQIRTKEDAIYNAKVDPGYETVEKADPALLQKWQRVTKHIESDNENDWRQAIIEADIMLADLLIKLGYKGEGIGEQLKRVVKGDFETLDQAWEAHKMRNIIAHEGSNFPITKFEARRVINLYHQVFKEFYDLQ